MDYSHHYHAGNIGDVWKHCGLLSCLSWLKKEQAKVIYLETHAGAGEYLLGPTGEWTEGAGKLIKHNPSQIPMAIHRYIETIQYCGFGSIHRRIYPGSPLLAGNILDENDQMVLYELVESTYLELVDHLSGVKAKVSALCQDGMTQVVSCLKNLHAAYHHVFLLIDPPYTTKPEWQQVPDLVVSIVNEFPKVCLMLWYPIKSYTRPDALLKRIKEAGISATALDLVTTPLDHKRNRLNGSGLLLINVPPQVIEELASSATIIGAACATHSSKWSLRVASWGKIK